MNSDTLSGQWKRLKNSAKAKWARLNDDDLMRAPGDYERLDYERLVGSIQERYGYDREQAEDEVNTWLDSLPSRPSRPSRPSSQPVAR